MSTALGRLRLPRALATDTLWSLAAEGARAVGLVVSFLLVARALGPLPYGVFVGINAIVTIVSPFANLGAPLLLLQRVRHDDRSTADAFETAVSMVVGGGLVSVVAMVAIGHVVMPEASAWAVVMLAVSDFLCFGLLQLCSGLAVSSNDMRWYTVSLGLGSAARVVASVAFLALADHTVVMWSAFQLAALALTAVVVVSMSARRYRVRVRCGAVTRADVVDGLPYSASIAVSSTQDGLDKPLMVRYGWGVEAGYYGAAYRVPALAMIPVQALVMATLNRSFVAGRDGVSAALALARRLLAPALAYSVVASVGIVVLAPVATSLLGGAFADTVVIIRWLALLPVLRTLQLFPANALMGAGHQRMRLALVMTTLVVNATLCLVLIPSSSWTGALIATFAAETLYALLLWVTVLVLASRERGRARSVDDAVALLSAD